MIILSFFESMRVNWQICYHGYPLLEPTHSYSILWIFGKEYKINFVVWYLATAKLKLLIN